MQRTSKIKENVFVDTNLKFMIQFGAQQTVFFYFFHISDLVYKHSLLEKDQSHLLTLCIL